MVRGRLFRPRYEGPFVLEGAAERPVFLVVVVEGVDRRSGGRRRHRHPSFFLVCAERDGGEGLGKVPKSRRRGGLPSRPGSDKRNGSYPVDATESDSATFVPTMRPKVFARNTDVAGGCLW